MATYAGRYSEDLQDRFGNAFRNATVAVQTTGGAAVTLYADRDKTAYVPASGLAANEIKSDDKGNLVFFADPGNYRIVVTPVGGVALNPVEVSVYPDPLEPVSTGDAYVPGGTDVAVADGGTGASTAAAARSNLGAAAENDLLKRALGPSNTVVLLGDSITAQNADDTTVPAGSKRHKAIGYMTWANVLLRHSLKLLLNAGISGHTTAQMLARVQDVVALAPGWCVVQGGGNDVAGGISAATTISNLAAIYAALRPAGIKVVACTVTPTITADTQGEKQTLHSINRWVKTYAIEQRDVILCDWFPVLADPSTGNPASGLTGDGVHPSVAGAALMGRTLADALFPHIGHVDVLQGAGDPANLLTNGMFTGNSSGAATPGWNLSNVSGTTSVAKVPRSDGYQGEWQQIVRLTSGIFDLWQTLTMASVGLVAGDLVQADVEFETDADWSGITDLRLTLNTYDSANVSQRLAADLFRAGAEPASNYNPRRGVLQTPAVAIPPAATKVQFSLIFSGVSGTLRVARAGLRKVT